MSVFLLISGCFWSVKKVGVTPAVEEYFSPPYGGNYPPQLLNYTLAEQFEIFLFGNRYGHPPRTELAGVVSMHGKAALDHVLAQSDYFVYSSDYAHTLRIIMVVEYRKLYAVCEDITAVSKLRTNAHKIEDVGWKEIYLKWLNEDLCPL